MCKTRFDSRELFSMVVNKIILHNMIRACETPPPHGKCNFKIPFFGRLPLGRPKFGHCLPLFCFHDCSLFRSKPVSTSWCFGARAGASCNYEQSKTKWKRHLEHCLWYGSLGRPKFGHCLPLFCFHDCSLFRLKPVSMSWCFGARAGASCNYEQSKTKWKRHSEHCLWYGSSGRPKQVHSKL